MTYATLQAEIADDLNRQDLTAVIPRFIRDGEAFLNSALRHHLMETVAPLQFNIDPDFAGPFVLRGGVATLPIDFLEARSLSTESNVFLEHVRPDSEEWLFKHRPSYPQYYTVDGGKILTRPIYTGFAVLGYYATIPALSNTNTSNWLLTRFPNIYRFAALVEGAKYLRDEPLEKSYMDGLDRAVAAAGMENRMARSSWGQVPPTVPSAETRDQMRRA